MKRYLFALFFILLHQTNCNLFGQSSVESLFVLANSQELTRGVSINQLPVLIFGLRINNDNHTKISLLDSINLTDHGIRKLQLIREAHIAIIDYNIDKTTVVIRLLKYGMPSWKKQIKRVESGHFVASHASGAKVFFVKDEQENGLISTTPLNTDSSQTEDFSFTWDNIVMPSNPKYALWKNDHLGIIYDKNSTSLARFFGNGLYLLSDKYPQELVNVLSKVTPKDKYFNSASLIRNDKKQRMIFCLNPETKERLIFAYDFAKKEWNSLSFTNMSFFDIDSWLCLSRNIQSPGNDLKECDNIFYSLPDLKERFRWRTYPKWELLSMEDGFMLYRIEDGIWGADYDGHGISNCRLLIRAPYLRGVHWAMKMPVGSFGNPDEWQPPKLYPVLMPNGYKTESNMEYFVTEPTRTEESSSQRNPVSSRREPAPIPSDGRYVVVSGDNLWSLGRRFHISIESIRKRNNLTTDQLVVGQILYLDVDEKKASAPGTEKQAAVNDDSKKHSLPQRHANEVKQPMPGEANGESVNADLRTNEVQVMPLRIEENRQEKPKDIKPPRGHLRLLQPTVTQ